MKHRRLIITGTVHGVFFRQTALQKAKELGVKGWVRNDPSGTVTISIEGDEENVNAFTNWSKNGPPSARVEGVIAEDLPIENFYHFEIIRN